MINKKNLTALAIVATTALFTVSCQKAADSNTATNQPVNTVAANTTQPANTAAPAADTSTAGTPTAAYKAAYAARNSKDVATLKNLMSKDIIEFFEMIGSVDPKKKQSVDEILRELCDKPQAPTPDTRNEKVNGDKATLEYLDEKGGWSTMDFVKEDGMWKLTIDKALEDVPSDEIEKKMDNKKIG